ncbi:hypothetical protein [Ralstonia pseudosolanacearum]|uniref:hypothetical protein n=1 Tax=Ralstonia pseudosolanacearum TaxID=1310165 RepID=UPI001FFC229C|nr:hypothetical protein [Ralstonia pseudosolanacearum]
MRVIVRLQGAANAQALFDVLRGRNVRWATHHWRSGWHSLAFDFASVPDAQQFIRDLFPDLRFTANT